jgi:hypothetical protein
LRQDSDLCSHPTIADKNGYCPTCDGSGLRTLERHVYRHPLKRALSEIGKRQVPKGRPKLDAVLWELAVHDGNVQMTIAALAMTYAYMWQPVKARRWISHALWELRGVYREDAPTRVIRKSESQSIAEAA